MKRLLFLFVIAIFCASACVHKKETPSGDGCLNCEKWSYSCADQWPVVCTTCKGRSQSPVNINTDSTASADMPDIDYRYSSSRLFLKNYTSKYSLYTYLPEDTNSVYYRGQQYFFAEFHLHTRSEHTVNNKADSMEIHLVHVDAQSQILVVALWVDIVPGTKNIVLDSVLAERNWPSLPDTVIGTDISINLMDLLPPVPRRSQRYYRYVGSLTTPKCTEGVTFLLLKDHIELSPEKLAFYRTKYNNTFRPTQKLNGRIVQSTRY